METTRYVNHCSADNTSSADIYLLIPLTIDENYDYIVSDSMFVIHSMKRIIPIRRRRRHHPSRQFTAYKRLSIDKF